MQYLENLLGMTPNQEINKLSQYLAEETKQFQNSIDSYKNDDIKASRSLIGIDYIFKTSIENIKTYYITNTGNHIKECQNLKTRKFQLKQTVLGNLDITKLSSDEKTSLVVLLRQMSRSNEFMVLVKNQKGSNFFTQVKITANAQFDFDSSSDNLIEILNNNLKIFKERTVKVQKKLSYWLKSKPKTEKIALDAKLIETLPITTYSSFNMLIFDTFKNLAGLLHNRLNNWKTYTPKSTNKNISYKYGIRCFNITTEFLKTRLFIPMSACYYEKGDHIKMKYTLDPFYVSNTWYQDPKENSQFSLLLKQTQNLAKTIPELSYTQQMSNRGGYALDLKKRISTNEISRYQLIYALKSLNGQANQILNQYMR